MKIYRKLTPLFLVALVISPLAAAEDATPDEDFEDDTLNAQPTSTWYNHTETDAGVTGRVIDCTSLADMDGQCYRFRHTVSGFKSLRFLVNAEPEIDDEISFDFNFLNSVSTTIWQQLQFNNGDRIRITYGCGSPYSFSDNHRICALEPGDTYNSFSLGDSSGRMRFVFDFPANTYDIYIDDVLKGTKAFHATSDDPPTALSSITFFDVVGGTQSVFMDNFDMHNVYLTGLLEEEVVEETPDPSEFNQAVDTLLDNLGYISEESRTLVTIFTMAAVQVGTAFSLRRLSSGQLKNSIILATGLLVAIGAIFIYGTEPWMIVLSIAIGLLFIMGGPREARNTFEELKERTGGAVRTIPLQLPFRRRQKENVDPIDITQGGETNLPFLRTFPQPDGELIIDNFDNQSIQDEEPDDE